MFTVHYRPLEKFYGTESKAAMDGNPRDRRLDPHSHLGLANPRTGAYTSCGHFIHTFIHHTIPQNTHATHKIKRTHILRVIILSTFEGFVDKNEEVRTYVADESLRLAVFPAFISRKIISLL